MKATKTQPNETPAAQLERARVELETAQRELSQFSVFEGSLDAAAARRRELVERVEIAKERIAMAQERFAESEFEQIENKIAELQVQGQQVEVELQEARECAAEDLREHLNHDWLLGQGRFASQPPALNQLVGFCHGVSAIEQQRDILKNEITRLENRVAEKRAQHDRDRRAAEVENRRRLIRGDFVAVPLVAWRVESLPGFGSDILDGLNARAIPCALVDQQRREIHILAPFGTTARNWIDSNHIESTEQIDPAQLCPAMAEVLARSGSLKSSM